MRGRRQTIHFPTAGTEHGTRSSSRFVRATGRTERLAAFSVTWPGRPTLWRKAASNINTGVPCATDVGRQRGRSLHPPARASTGRHPRSRAKTSTFTRFRGRRPRRGGVPGGIGTCQGGRRRVEQGRPSRFPVPSRASSENAAPRCDNARPASGSESRPDSRPLSPRPMVRDPNRIALSASWGRSSERPVRRSDGAY